MTWRVGIDIGGTFTDVAMVEEATGRIQIAKVPTTPLDFAQGVLHGLRAGLARAEISAREVTLLSHATTVVTNALLEKKGAHAAFIGTRGFRDILELRRSMRTDLYNLFQDSPPVIIPRRDRYEITERIDAQGEVITPLDEDEVPALVVALRASGVRTVAVTLLFSFLNDTHERRLGALLHEGLPGVKVFLSCDVLPEIREFERASTTAVCAYVGPILESYLERLQQAVSEAGLPALHIMGSSGGVVDIAECLRMPAQAVESGPAAGVIAAALAGEQLGETRLISFDMGGTTAKASVIVDGEVAVSTDYEVGGATHATRWTNGTGHPIRVPVIDLAEVSSGGGSIAWIDPGGALKVGPSSAGALPGPVAYGQGGTLPTVTDANVVLGYLNPVALLDGELPIDRAGAEASIVEHIAGPLGLTAIEAAARIIAVVNANMAEALNIVSVERGHDPREFAMLAFGGAGPLHAMALASGLAIPRVIIPPGPGAFSALGLVASDLKRDYARSFYSDLASVDVGRFAAAFAAMADEGAAMLDAALVPPAARSLKRSADLRYRRQAYELIVPLPDGDVTPASLAALAAAFHEKHLRTYGHANAAEPVQIVNLRLTAIGRRPKLRLRQPASGGTMAHSERNAWFEGFGMIPTRVARRDGMAPGMRMAGPAILESLDSTIVIPPGWLVRVDADGFLNAEETAHGTH